MPCGHVPRKGFIPRDEQIRMHSADPTSGRSVRQTPRGHEGANTHKWGICRNFMGDNQFFTRQGRFGAESDDAARRYRRLSHHPPVTATGEGRS